MDANDIPEGYSVAAHIEATGEITADGVEVHIIVHREDEIIHLTMDEATDRSDGVHFQCR